MENNFTREDSLILIYTSKMDYGHSQKDTFQHFLDQTGQRNGYKDF